jgi:hypothetical protein
LPRIERAVPRLVALHGGTSIAQLSQHRQLPAIITLLIIDAIQRIDEALGLVCWEGGGDAKFQRVDSSSRVTT